jgi:Altronate dehydratase
LKETLFEQSFHSINFKNDSFSRNFQGYLRKDGKAGTRNYIGLVSTVNCSATVVKQIANKINNHLNHNSFKNIDGAVCLKHSSGCGMNTNGYGMEVFYKTIEGFKNHPNFSHVFVIGLGCECAQISLFQNNESSNIKYLNIQDEGGSTKIINKCFNMICEILPISNKNFRSTIPVEKLSVALQCGGSDSYSGITANPALGYASDILVSLGGSSILSETPEIYGAEHLLKGRTNEKDLQNKIDKHILWWQNYTKINGGSLDNNPSPGNKKGGLTTILEKSLGATAKSGKSELVDVIDYAEK